MIKKYFADQFKSDSGKFSGVASAAVAGAAFAWLTLFISRWLLPAAIIGGAAVVIIPDEKRSVGYFRAKTSYVNAMFGWFKARIWPAPQEFGTPSPSNVALMILAMSLAHAENTDLLDRLKFNKSSEPGQYGRKTWIGFNNLPPDVQSAIAEAFAKKFNFAVGALLVKTKHFFLTPTTSWLVAQLYKATGNRLLSRESQRKVEIGVGRILEAANQEDSAAIFAHSFPLPITEAKLRAILKLDERAAAIDEVYAKAHDNHRSFYEIARYLTELGKPIEGCTSHLLAQVNQATNEGRKRNVSEAARKLLGAAAAEIAGQHAKLAARFQAVAFECTKIHEPNANDGWLAANAPNVDYDATSIPIALQSIFASKETIRAYYHAAQYGDLESVTEALAAHCASELYFLVECAAMRRHLSDQLEAMESLQPGSTKWLSAHYKPKGVSVDDEHFNDALTGINLLSLMGEKYLHAAMRGLEKFRVFNEHYTADIDRMVDQHRQPKPMLHVAALN